MYFILTSSLFIESGEKVLVPEFKLSFLGIVLRVQRLEVYVYKVYITNQFQTTFDPGGGGVKSISIGDYEQQGGKLLSVSKVGPRTRPLDLTAHTLAEFLSEFGLC